MENLGKGCNLELSGSCCWVFLADMDMEAGILIDTGVVLGVHRRPRNWIATELQLSFQPQELYPNSCGLVTSYAHIA